MNGPLPTMQEAAQEAEFQLLAAKDVLEWQHALIKAIHLDHLHDGGKGIGALFEVAKYFNDTGFGGVYSAIDQFKELGESTPQNAGMSDRGAHGIGTSVSLAEFAERRQTAAADQLGITQQALNTALKLKRQIQVLEMPDGSVTAIETKAFPAPNRRGRQ
ncbi:Cro/CI family transcriptional regulator [Pseudomonas sp. NFACC04-2]|uniref:Cro/CI family transcriptional regulator n=1 Tax=Pseudomonas sp. NFACC04-2 TaxID=1566242 RepID=UPI000908BA9B|nr:Cro/CI family transcriptional regulator [Pseudomonas sp. NFACC04-2]SFW77489.1 Cro protein [Pseudomonas sp. NFACC04-2]